MNEVGHPRRWLILAVLASVAFMAQLDLFIVNIAVPAMGRSFGGAGISGLSWVLNAYAIVFAALLVPAGRLADHHGRRLFLLSGIAVFVAASVACALAPNLPTLVAARAVQAVGAAMIIPPSLGLLFPAFPKDKHTLVVGIWAGVSAVAATAGAPIGGLLVAVDWRWIFLVNVPVGIAALATGLIVLPEIKAPRTAKLPDPVSSIALFLGVSLLVFAMAEAPDLGWTSPLVLGAAVLAVAAVATTTVYAHRHPHPLVEAALFRTREFSTAAIALFLYYIGFAAWLLITVLFLQNLWHYDAIQAGLAIAPGPLVSALFAVNAGRIADRFGRRLPAIIGPALMTVSAAYWVVFAPPTPSYLLFLPGLILGGMSAGLTQAPLFASSGSLPPDRATTGAAVLNMGRQIGSALGVAVLVALMATATPNALYQFRRGWWLEIVVSLLAVAVLVTGSARRTPSSRPEPAPRSPLHAGRSSG
jgi:EmrB/QacA subfamily drug resistance transporter